MADHLKKICSAIGQLPLHVDFDVEDLDTANPAASLLTDEDTQAATKDTSFSRPRPAKRKKSPVKKGQN